MMLNERQHCHDHLLTRLGGPKTVMSRLRELGVTGMDVSRPTAQIVADFWGFACPGERDRKSWCGYSTAPHRHARQSGCELSRITGTRDSMRWLSCSPRSSRDVHSQRRYCAAARHDDALQDRSQHQGPAAARTTSGAQTDRPRRQRRHCHAAARGWPMISAIYLTASTQPRVEQDRALASAAVALYRYYNPERHKGCLQPRRQASATICSEARRRRSNAQRRRASRTQSTLNVAIHSRTTRH
jgi:hypothetical protein